ncbi:MAG: TatD family hydrolase, partial [Coriobacteriales bacterium]|nr:TatD family hydrolase [Coriobacteriales bacterium]
VFYDAKLRDAKHRVVEAPSFAAGTQIADTHAHLDMLHYPGLALARAAAHRVSFVVSIVDPTEDPSFTLDNLGLWQQEAGELLQAWRAGADPAEEGSAEQRAAKQAAKQQATGQQPAAQQAPELPAATPPDVRIIMGCHPHNASAYTEAIEERLVQALTTDPRVTGIGEIGLDYHYDNSPREVQQEVFRRQIRLAHEHGSTIALHLREAHADGLRILKEEGAPARGVLLHCFNLDYATLEPFLELGVLVAFGGPLTFKKSDEVRDAATRTPLERLVTETDCPFMAPVPVRGSVCEPASVVFTAEVLANLHDEPDALQQIYANARGFFA